MQPIIDADVVDHGQQLFHRSTRDQPPNCIIAVALAHPLLLPRYTQAEYKNRYQAVDIMDGEDTESIPLCCRRCQRELEGNMRIADRTPVQP
jgi:hypothetical protein